MNVIDQILTSYDIVADAGTISLDISDHVPIFVRIKKERNDTKKEKFMGRSYLNFDVQKIAQMLNSHDWDVFYNIQNVSEAWEYMEGKIREMADALHPEKEFKVRQNRPAWLSAELIELYNLELHQVN